MFRTTISSVIILVCLGSTSLAQSDKPYTPAVGQKYKPTKGGAAVAKDVKGISDYIKARQKGDTGKIFDLMTSGAMERITEGTILEVVKIEPKSDEHPSGLIECNRIVGGESRGSVYLGGDILIPGFLVPADEATKLSSAPAATDAPPTTATTRTWKAAAGGFEVEAELVSADEKNVVLKRKADGKEITVGLDKLSDEDRNWLAEQASITESEVPVPDIAFEIAKPDITVSAVELAADFAADMNAGREKYRGKVCVEGAVHRIIDEEFGGQKIQKVELKAGNNRIVQCGVTVYWTKYLSTLKPGSKVAIVGISVDLMSEKPFVVSMIGGNFVKPM